MPMRKYLKCLYFQATEIKEEEGKQIAQYTPLNESEHKEVDRKHKLNSARVYFYQVCSQLGRKRNQNM